ncbi:hypothetical protein I79_007043 [Cricetulus griseus]|uniref:Uncharacterized protein n=1 Tax=Cricetulus griseus TaxID=10029 RepID=G3H9H1_CRIGR|nr:hypothetical protein I79_007043 [Cricetulus griseus]
MFLSPFNGECATWLIMCFQNGRFSDNSRRATVIPQSRQKGDSHRSTHRLRTRMGGLITRTLGCTPCHLCNTRSSGGNMKK